MRSDPESCMDGFPSQFWLSRIRLANYSRAEQRRSYRMPDDNRMAVNVIVDRISQFALFSSAPMYISQSSVGPLHVTLFTPSTSILSDCSEPSFLCVGPLLGVVLVQIWLPSVRLLCKIAFILHWRRVRIVFMHVRETSDQSKLSKGRAMPLRWRRRNGHFVEGRRRI
jgi:hypothetical protein